MTHPFPTIALLQDYGDHVCQGMRANKTCLEKSDICSVFMLHLFSCLFRPSSVLWNLLHYKSSQIPSVASGLIPLCHSHQVYGELCDQTAVTRGDVLVVGFGTAQGSLQISCHLPIHIFPPLGPRWQVFVAHLPKHDRHGTLSSLTYF